MTCIVGLADGKNVWIGGDSLTGNSDYNMTMRNPKVIKREVGELEIIFGGSGTHRGGYLIEKMTFPEFVKGTDVEEYIGIHLVNSIRETYRNNGYLTLDNNKEEHDCTFLFGIGGRLFGLWSDFGIVESQEGYWAIGSGMYLALGSLYTTRTMDIKPFERVNMALFAAIAHNPYVCSPIHIEKI